MQETLFTSIRQMYNKTMNVVNIIVFFSVLLIFCYIRINPYNSYSLISIYSFKKMVSYQVCPFGLIRYLIKALMNMFNLIKNLKRQNIDQMCICETFYRTLRYFRFNKTASRGPFSVSRVGQTFLRKMHAKDSEEYVQIVDWYRVRVLSRV